MFVCVYSVFVLFCVGSGLRRADHSSKESYQLFVSVRLRNLIRGGQGPIWAGAPLEDEEEVNWFMSIHLHWIFKIINTLINENQNVAVIRMGAGN
jgi:hypothetical protein